MSELFRRTFAEINLDHLSHNFFEIQKVANQTGSASKFLCPMVKANGYGHGDVQIAKHLEKCGVENLGVCLIEEGLLLRKSGVQADILVFRGFDKYGAQKILDHHMIPVVSTWDQIHCLESIADDPVSVHLKFNTGMNRLGFDPDQAEPLFTYFKNSKKLKLKAILSHFFNGEDAYLENGDSKKQTDQMELLLSFFKPLNVFAHLLNSGGIASLAKIHADSKNRSNHYLQKNNWGFRPGLILYGYQPKNIFSELNLKPVMSLKSVVNNIRDVKKGESVSYGAKWVADRDSKIAVVPIGYADGIHRLLSNKNQALFSGQAVPIVGRICMDFLMLDVTDVICHSNSHIQNKKYDDEEVVLFGYDQDGQFLSAEKAAEAAQSITWEMLTSVGERVPRLFKGGAEL
jgi:alanine racemase